MSELKWLPTAEAFPKKNVLTPIGAFAFGTFAASIAAASYLGDTAMGWTVLVAGLLPLLATLWGFFHFAHTDPDRLQTEDYRIQREIVAKIEKLPDFEGNHFPPSNSKPVQRITHGRGDRE
jgi:hypothetical protein